MIHIFLDLSIAVHLNFFCFFPADATSSLLCVTATLIRQNFATKARSTYEIIHLPFVKMSSTINLILFVYDIEF